MSSLKRFALAAAATAAIVAGMVAGAAVPASAASSCPATVANHFLGGGYYGAQWATNSRLVSTSTPGGYLLCTYYGTIHTYAAYGSGETSTGGTWSAYAGNL